MRNYLKADELKTTEEKSSLISTIIPVQVKYLTTKDGLGKAVGLYVGQTVWIDIKTIEQKEITEFNGIKHTQLTVDRVDEFGNVLGWLYYEFFANVEAFDKSRGIK